MRTAPRIRDFVTEEHGYGIAVMFLLGVVLAAFATAMIATSMSNINLTEADRSWEEAVFVAEGVTDRALETITADVEWNTGDVAVDPSDRDSVIKRADLKPDADLVAFPGGEAIVIKPADEDVLLGVAFVPTRDDANRKVRVVRMDLDIRRVGGGAFGFTGAIAGKGTVTIKDGAQVVTTPANGHNADVHSNTGFSGEGNGYVDGSVTSSGSVSVGPGFGIWDPDHPEGESGVDPIPFPTQQEIMDWEQELIDAAKAGGTIGTISLGGGDTRTVNTPVYINGKIELSGNSRLEFVGGGTVYVKMTVETKDNAVLANGGLLAVGRTFEMYGTSEYQATSDDPGIALVSFHTGINAIEIKGSAVGAHQGVIYAAQGGVELKEGGTFIGGIVAGGNGATGKVEIKDNARLEFPSDLLEKSTIFPTKPEVSIKHRSEL